MTSRGIVLLGIVLGSFAVMIAVGAALTEGKAEGPLSLGDVFITATIPVLVLIAVTVVCRTRTGSRSRMAATAPPRSQCAGPDSSN